MSINEDFETASTQMERLKLILEIYLTLWGKESYKLMEKKCGIDELMKSHSQLEKMKKFMMESEEEINLFNNLPDLDMEEALHGIDENKKKHMRASIANVMLKNPDSKILDVLKKI